MEKPVRTNEAKAEEATENERFNPVYDPKTKRVSYDGDIRDHFVRDLRFIAGVLDMIFLLNEGGDWDMLGGEAGMVFMEARDRAIALADCI